MFVANGPPRIPRVMVTDDELMRRCIDAGILAKIRNNAFTPRESRKPSKAIDGGVSIMTRYYYCGEFICTTHELLAKEGSRRYFNFTEAVIDGVWYHSRELFTMY